MNRRNLNFLSLALGLLLAANACGTNTPWPITTNAVILTDLDGDGDLDAFLANGRAEGAATNTVWLNQGGVQGGKAGAFADSGQTFGEAPYQTAALGDLNGDGYPDALVSTGGWLELYLYQGNAGSLFRVSNAQLNPGPDWSGNMPLALGDLNGDGCLDVFAGNCCGFGSSNGTQIVPHPPSNIVWLNDPQQPGNLRVAQRQATAGTVDVALGDVDGDGDLDAVTANFTANVPPIAGPATGNVWLNDGTGRFQDNSQRLGAPTHQSVALGDLDGDGDLDAVLGHNAGPTAIWFNDGQGRFTDSGQALGQAQARRIRLGDVDGDGDVDALIERLDHGAVYGEIWLNDGQGFLHDSGQRLAAAYQYALALGDVEGDGDLDVFAGGPTDIKIWLNDGAGRFSPTP
jgi:hypothetical protein